MENGTFNIKSISERQLRTYIREAFIDEPDKYLKFIDLINKVYLGKFINFLYSCMVNGAIGYREIEMTEEEIKSTDRLNKLSEIEEIINPSGYLKCSLLSHTYEEDSSINNIPNFEQMLSEMSETGEVVDTKEMVNTYFDILGVLYKFDNAVMRDLMDKEYDGDISYLLVIDKYSRMELIVC